MNTRFLWLHGLSAAALLVLAAPVATAAPQCSSDDMFEDNDSCLHPVPLGAGSYPGLRVGKGDPDFYSVTLPAGATGDVQVFHPYLAGDIDLYVYRADACGGGLTSSVAGSFTTRSRERAMWTNEAGVEADYIVEVRFYRWFALSGCNTYSLTLGGVVAGPGTPGVPSPPPSIRVDKIGFRALNASGPFPGKGNTWRLDDDVLLRGVEARLQLNGSATIDLDVYVGQTEFSDYRRVLHRSQVFQGTGNGVGWYGFHDLALALDGGTYALIVFSSPDAPVHQFTIASNEPRGFGTYVHGYATGPYPMPSAVNNSVNDAASYLRRVYWSPPTREFCDATENSTGVPARISSTGSTSLGANDFELAVADCPSQVSGLFFLGSEATQVALGGGTRCAGGRLLRLPVQQVDASGAAGIALDWNSATFAGSSVAVGTTWSFQFWYRDPSVAAVPFNLSSALMVTFSE